MTLVKNKRELIHIFTVQMIELNIFTDWTLHSFLQNLTTLAKFRLSEIYCEFLENIY